MNTNNSSGNGFSRSPECNALAPLLALRNTGMLGAEEADIVERHLASCDACQRDTALDATLAGRLCEALIPAAAVEPALTARQIADAVVESDAADSVIRDADEHLPVVVRHAAPLRFSAASRLSRLSALAAVLAVVVLAAYIFGGHFGGSTHPGPVPATVTLSPKLSQETVYLPTSFGIYALRASDGAVRWAFPAGIKSDPMQAVHDVLDIFGLSLDHGTLYALTSAPGYGSFGDKDPRLYALNAANGSIRWSVRIPDLVTSSPFAPSLLQAGHLLVVAPTVRGFTAPVKDNQTVFAFNTANGNLVWHRTLDEPVLSNLVAAGGSVYIGTPGHVVALNAADGAILWTSPIVPSAQQEGTNLAAAYSSVALSASGERVYALAKRAITSPSAAHDAAYQANFYAIAASDGSHIWRDSVENDPWGTAFAPTLAGNSMYVAFGGGIRAIALDGTTPKDRWRFIPSGSTTQNPAMTGAVISGGIIYTTDLTGVIAHRDGLTFQENCTYAVRASDGVELWRTPSDGGLLAATPVVADGLVFAPAAATLKVFHAGNGHLLWQYPMPAGSSSVSPLVGP